MPKLRYFRPPTRYEAAKAMVSEICKKLRWREDLILDGRHHPEIVALRREIAQELCFVHGFVPNEIAYALNRERTTIYGLLEMRKGEKNYDYRPNSPESLSSGTSSGSPDLPRGRGAGQNQPPIRKNHAPPHDPATQIRADFEKVGFNIHPECPAFRFLWG